MDEELQRLLTNAGTGAAIGLIIGLIIRRMKPDWARRWVKFVLNGQWKLFAAAAVLFGLGAVILWHGGQAYTAMASALMSVLELAALVRYGFKPLTPEMAQRIDAS